MGTAAEKKSMKGTGSLDIMRSFFFLRATSTFKYLCPESKMDAILFKAGRG